jgi:hypothetical protein
MVAVRRRKAAILPEAHQILPAASDYALHVGGRFDYETGIRPKQAGSKRA